MEYVRLLVLFVLLLATPGCEGDAGIIEIENETRSDVVTVTIDPCGADGPGPNRLGTGRIVPGAREAFSVGFGCYDVVAVTANGMRGTWQVGINAVDRRATLFAREP